MPLKGSGGPVRPAFAQRAASTPIIAPCAVAQPFQSDSRPARVARSGMFGVIASDTALAIRSRSSPMITPAPTAEPMTFCA